LFLYFTQLLRQQTQIRGAIVPGTPQSHHSQELKLPVRAIKMWKALQALDMIASRI